jgi:hypothetical protein
MPATFLKFTEYELDAKLLIPTIKNLLTVEKPEFFGAMKRRLSARCAQSI